MKQSNLKGI